jgi:hypothetical protein
LELPDRFLTKSLASCSFDATCRQPVAL